MAERSDGQRWMNLWDRLEGDGQVGAEFGRKGVTGKRLRIGAETRGRLGRD